MSKGHPIGTECIVLTAESGLNIGKRVRVLTAPVMRTSYDARTGELYPPRILQCVEFIDLPDPPDLEGGKWAYPPAWLLPLWDEDEDKVTTKDKELVV